jgi:hypothetical protein
VVKDLKSIDWKLQYILKTQYKSKTLYTSSRKEFANYMITKIWSYMRQTYGEKWEKRADKYAYVLDLKRDSKLLLSTQQSVNGLSGLYGVNLKLYDDVYIRQKYYHYCLNKVTQYESVSLVANAIQSKNHSH